MSEKGHISINAENILTIIKKWLYSEEEIFLRELVANAADALTKLNKISLLGETGQEIPEAKITVSLDKNAKTLTITDTGLGMTREEIKKYINQVAFSGLQDFIQKYKDKGDEHQIIGHFGLGFYSSFMVADKVEIDTLSYQPGSEAAHWSCDGSTEFEIVPSSKKDIGTSVILYISDDSREMLEPTKIKAILEKYCAFVRYPIELDNKVVNDPTPLWTKSPNELGEKDYLDFFHRVFPISPDPLFWIQLNVDYPFKLKGVLYFPKLRHELDASQGEVKLFCNQVYVADNCKELVPEFLTLLKGVVDCPELPLNVSRSHLQNDPQVQTISQHITKKVADKLTGMAKTDRESYEKHWLDIHPFVKYGMMRDPKFYERLKEHLIFKTITGSFVTMSEYLEAMKDKTEGQIIYVTDENVQAGYISMFKEHGLNAVIANSVIDIHFIPFVEMQETGKFKFRRIDADVSTSLIDSSEAAKIVDPTDNKNVIEKIEKLFLDNLSAKKVKVRVENLKSAKVPAMILFDENMRRFRDMSRFMGPLAELQSSLQDDHTLVVNLNNLAIKNLVRLSKSFNKQDQVKLIVDQVYDLAFLQQGRFDAERLQVFIERSSSLLEFLERDPDEINSPSTRNGNTVNEI